jgi:hypothetical protein
MKLSQPRTFFLLIVSLAICITASAQNHWKNKTGFTMEYGNIPAWAGIVDLVPKGKKPVYIFDDNIYKGHSNFVLRSLKRKVTFSTFKELVKYPATRQYIPFNLYDLRKKEFSYNGEKYLWALKMCDYRLQDNPAEMITLLNETYTYLKNYLKSVDTACGKGIILLSNSEEATPNTSSLAGLKTQGLPVCALKEFYGLIKYNANTTHVLNGGSAIGALHFVPEGDENNTINDENAIYVYEKTPERVPLARGFITLQPQTYLSHINLLAINRKTPNVSSSDKELLSEIKSLDGKIVKLVCDKDKNSIDFEKPPADYILPITSARKKTNLVQYDLSTSEIVDLDDSLKNSLNYVGAKAANYALLQKYFPAYVKKGMAIPFSFYKKLISSKLLSSKIEELANLPDTAKTQRPDLQLHIRRLILAAHLSADLLNDIKDCQNKKFAGKKIRIRSSTNCEDLPEFNGAGLYISKGIKWDDMPDDIEKKLLAVYASIWSDNACSERRFFGIEHADAGMAILVNEAYEGEWANGVALIMPGDSGKNQLVIDAQPGDHEVTNPKSGDVPEELFFSNASTSKYTVTSRSNYGKVFLGIALTKNMAEELRKLCLDIDGLLKSKLKPEEKKNFGTDIEFKIVLQNGKAKLWVKQARLLNLGVVQ